MAFVSDLGTLGTGPSYGKYLASGVRKAGTRQLLLDLSMLPSDKAGVVAAACAVRDQVVTPASIKFHIDGLEGSNAVVRVAMPAAPKSVSVVERL